jgi:uncharacterized protein YcfL
MKKIIVIMVIFTSMSACNSPQTNVQSESIVTDTTSVDVTETVIDTLSITEIDNDVTETDGSVIE